MPMVHRIRELSGSSQSVPWGEIHALLLKSAVIIQDWPQALKGAGEPGWGWGPLRTRKFLSASLVG
jgi:hypothetical protein